MRIKCVYGGSVRSLRVAKSGMVLRAVGALAFGMASAESHADSVNSPNITINVDTNRSTGSGAGNVAVTVNTVTIAETSVNEYSVGANKSITFTARTGYQFDSTSNITAQSATIGFNGASANAIASVTPTGAANEVITFTLTSGTSGGQDIIRVNGIKLKILSVEGAAGPAQTTLSFTTATAGGAFTDQGIVAASIAKGAADHLVFSAQPGSTQSGSILFPAVKIVDFGNNLVSTDPRTITLAIQNNPGSATLLGTNAILTDSGIASWGNIDLLRIATAATSYTLRASHNGANFLTSDSVDSGGFDISAGAPDHLVITQQPVDTTAGGDILLAVTVKDSSNNTVTAPPVSVSLDSAVGLGSWPILVDSNLTKATVGGVATWDATDHLRINKAISNYKLVASGVGAPVETDQFDVAAAGGNSLNFVDQPTDTLAGAAIDPAISVEILDAFGNRIDSTATVTLSLDSACAGALTGGSANAVAGLATFAAIKIDTPCDGVELTAASANISSTSSASFNVTALPAVALRFVQQPTDVAGGFVMKPAVTVETIDASGNRVSSSAFIELTLVSSCGGQLSDTGAGNAINGLVTFADLAFDDRCTGNTLIASSQGLTSVTSNEFDVTAAPPLELHFVQQPTTVQEGNEINPTVKLEILDQLGDRADSSATVHLTLQSNCGGLLSETSVSAVHGLATFSGLSVDTPCTDVTLAASAGGLTGAESDPFDVTAATGGGVHVFRGFCGQGVVAGLLPALMVLLGWKSQTMRRRRSMKRS